MALASKDVWITGIGAATPLGHSYEAIAESLLQGRTGIHHIMGFDASEHASQIGGQVLEVPCPQGIDHVLFAGLNRLEQVALWCASSALRDAGWWDRRADVRLGLVLGIGAEWLVVWEASMLQGGRRIFEPEQNANCVTHDTRRRLGLHGPAVTVAAACASGNYALALARQWLQLGWVDVCLAGACEMAVTPMCLAGFGNLRALSRRNSDPPAASRPFDTERDGFVMSEGGTLFVLEPAPTARQRGAHAYGRIAGCGASSDAHHMVIPSPDPAPAVAAMRQAFDDAAKNPGDIDYVNAHATSTPVGDVGETRVLESVFGPHIKKVPVSSTKSMTGHLLTAAAAVEALACLVAIERGAVPPTINLHNPDPECNLCHVPNTAQERRVRVTASNSFGFGGSNTCLVLEGV
jgi:3-oxoacyl-[acyl-carrier-protein] synthase II